MVACVGLAEMQTPLRFNCSVTTLATLALQQRTMCQVDKTALLRKISLTLPLIQHKTGQQSGLAELDKKLKALLYAQHQPAASQPARQRFQPLQPPHTHICHRQHTKLVSLTAGASRTQAPPNQSQPVGSQPCCAKEEPTQLAPPTPAAMMLHQNWQLTRANHHTLHNPRHFFHAQPTHAQCLCL